jgi:hypothetical protein
MDRDNRILRERKAQISMEFMLTMGLMMMIMMAMFTLSTTGRRDTVEYDHYMRLKNPCDYLSNIISNVYMMGHGVWVVDQLDYNFTIFGVSNIILISDVSTGENHTYYCKYPRITVTNGFNNSFQMTRFNRFIVENHKGVVEISPEQRDEGLVAWWTFDDVHGQNIEDRTDNAHLGVVMGNAIQSSNGKAGKSFVFDGDEDYIEINDHEQLSGGGKDMTVTAWFNTVDAGEFQHIVSKTADGSNKDYYLRILDSRLRFGYEDSGNNWDTTDSNGEGIKTILSNRWYFGAFTYNFTNRQVVLYLNGTIEGQWVLPTDLPDTSGSLMIGIQGYDGDAGFEGKIDDIRVYNRMLSEDEINQLYESYFSYMDLYRERIPT